VILEMVDATGKLEVTTAASGYLPALGAAW
jgi:hypothetical protein